MFSYIAIRKASDKIKVKIELWFIRELSKVVTCHFEDLCVSTFMDISSSDPEARSLPSKKFKMNVVFAPSREMMTDQDPILQDIKRNVFSKIGKKLSGT